MRHHFKKWVPLALLFLATAALPAWSEDQPAEPAATAPAATEEGAATAPAPAESGDVSAPPATGEEVSGTPATANTGESEAVSAAPQAAAGPSEASAVETNAEGFNPFNWLVYKPLWGLSNLVGNFNPVGNNIAAPLEDKFPGFRFKGYINDITQINTTSTNHAVGLGKRNKDWVLQKQEIRTQIELKYQATEHVEVVSVDNFQWDGAYRMQASQGLYWDGSKNQEYYQQAKRIFREEYIRGNYNTVNWTLGKQIVNWGKMDGKVLDFVNAYDGRDGIDFHIGDYEWRAIGQWMALVSLRPTETLTASLLWNPDFQPNVGAANGSPYFTPRSASPKAGTALTQEINPSGLHHLADSEVGIRLDSTVGDLSLSGIYYYGYDRAAVSFFDGLKHHVRVHRYGFATDYATNILGQRFAVRTEGLYTTGKAYKVTDKTLPKALQNFISYKDLVLLAANFETSIGTDENKFDFSYSPSWQRQLGYDRRTGENRHNIIHKIGVAHSVHATNDKLTLAANTYITGGSYDNGLSYNVNGTWKFNDFVAATLTYNDYIGTDGDGHGTLTPYGAYRKWKNVTLDVKYEW